MRRRLAAMWCCFVFKRKRTVQKSHESIPDLCRCIGDDTVSGTYYHLTQLSESVTVQKKGDFDLPIHSFQLKYIKLLVFTAIWIDFSYEERIGH